MEGAREEKWPPVPPPPPQYPAKHELGAQPWSTGVGGDSDQLLDLVEHFLLKINGGASVLGSYLSLGL